MTEYPKSEFGQFCAYLEKKTGIVINEDKKYLVESRVMPIVRRQRLSGLLELLKLLENDRMPALAQEVLEAMTINETYFFRDKSPFDIIGSSILPALQASLPRTETIRILSAACSSGQEPYSISMLIEENKHAYPGRAFEILAVDVSEAILEKAAAGVFGTFEVDRGLTPERKQRHFIQEGNRFRIRPEIRSRVKFKPLNLMGSYIGLGSFDFILCRNVLIYFSATEKRNVLRKLCELLKPHGCIMLGASESVVGLGTQLVPDARHPSCLQLKNESAVAPSGNSAANAWASQKMPLRTPGR